MTCNNSRSPSLNYERKKERETERSVSSTFRGLERVKISSEANLALFTANLHILDGRRVEGRRTGGINRDISRAEVRLDESNRSSVGG